MWSYVVTAIVRIGGKQWVFRWNFSPFKYRLLLKEKRTTELHLWPTIHDILQQQRPSATPTLVNNQLQTSSTPTLVNNQLQTSSTPTLVNNQLQTSTPTLVNNQLQSPTPTLVNNQLQSPTPTLVNNQLKVTFCKLKLRNGWRNGKFCFKHENRCF